RLEAGASVGSPVLHCVPEHADFTTRRVLTGSPWALYAPREPGAGGEGLTSDVTSTFPGCRAYRPGAPAGWPALGQDRPQHQVLTSVAWKFVGGLYTPA